MPHVAGGLAGLLNGLDTVVSGVRISKALLITPLSTSPILTLSVGMFLHRQGLLLYRLA